MSAYSQASTGMQVLGHQQGLVHRDLYTRFAPWPWLLLVMTLGIAAINGDWLGRPDLIAVMCGLYLFNWWLQRRAHPPESAETLHSALWQRRVWLHIYANSLIWGLFYAWIGSTQPMLSYPFLLATGATQALAFSSCDSYPMQPRKCMAALLLLQMPCVLVLLTDPSGFKLVSFFVLPMVLQWVRICSSARRYAYVLHSEIALQESRREIERLSSQDSLTGLSNRRGMESTFYSQWHLASRQQAAISLIALDVDNIKRLNERLGHNAGDACLRHVAELLRTQFRRSSDLVARMGGDSFAVLLPQTDAAEAMRLAREVRDQLANTPLEWESQQFTITASLGVDCARWDIDLCPEDSLRRITAACHEAKTKGRNRVLQA